MTEDESKEAVGWRELAAGFLVEAAIHPQSDFPELDDLDAGIRAAWIRCAMAARERAKALEQKQ